MELMLFLFVLVSSSIAGIIASLLVTVVLRAAVFLANKFLKPKPVASQRQQIDLPADFLAEQKPAEARSRSVDMASNTNPYATLRNANSTKTKKANKANKANKAKLLAIPEPSFGRAWAITCVQSVAILVVVALFCQAPISRLVVSVGGIVFGFVITMLVYASMLPTTGGRAVVVFVLQLLLFWGLAAIAFAVILISLAITN